jgi:hypothetical protein
VDYPTKNAQTAHIGDGSYAEKVREQVIINRVDLIAENLKLKQA